MCLIGFIVTQRRAHDGSQTIKFLSQSSGEEITRSLQPPLGDTFTPLCSAQRPVVPSALGSVTLWLSALWICCSARFVGKKQGNALILFSRMHPVTEEKIELGFGEHRKVNPAFVVSVAWNGFSLSTTTTKHFCELNFECEIFRNISHWGRKGEREQALIYGAVQCRDGMPWSRSWKDAFVWKLGEKENLDEGIKNEELRFVW